MMSLNKYTLGTIIGTATLGLAKAKSGGRSINLPITRYYNGIPIYKPQYLEDLYDLTPEEKLSVRYLTLKNVESTKEPCLDDLFEAEIPEHDNFRILSEQQKIKYDEINNNFINTLYDFFEQFDDIFIGFDNIEILEIKSFGSLSYWNSVYLKKNQEPNWNRLPSSLYNLKKLKRLLIGGNNLYYIPEQLSNLENLEQISVLSYNPIKYIPKSLSKLKKLRSLWSGSIPQHFLPFTRKIPNQVLLNLVVNGCDIKDLLRLNPPTKSNLRLR